MKKIAVITAVVLIAAGLVFYGHKCVKKAGGFDSGKRNDFTVYREAADRFARGGDPYNGDPARPFVYTPAFAAAMVPFALAGPTAGATAWYILNVAAFLAAFILVFNILRSAGLTLTKPIHHLVWLIPLVIMLRFADSNMQLGQANIIAAFLIILGLYLVLKKREYAGGAVVGAAALIKLSPLVIIAYFAFKRRWKAAGAAAVAFVAFALIPQIYTSALGGPNIVESYVSSINEFQESTTGEGGDFPGQSVFSLAARFLTPVNALHHTDGTMCVNILELPQEWAMAAAFFVCGILIGITMFVSRTPQTVEPPILFVLEYAAVICLMLLVSPVSRKAQFTALVLPIAAISCFLVFSNQGKAARRILWAAAAFMFAVFVLSSGDIAGKNIGDILQACSVFTFGLLDAWAAVVYLIALERMKEAENPAGGRDLTN